uniref:Putative secreted peptide n=1 Tax=Anopheles braziliensis TaxID=58242 RepID=A0A2M3ZUT0_9DIPT
MACILCALLFSGMLIEIESSLLNPALHVLTLTYRLDTNKSRAVFGFRIALSAGHLVKIQPLESVHERLYVYSAAVKPLRHMHKWSSEGVIVLAVNCEGGVQTKHYTRDVFVRSLSDTWAHANVSDAPDPDDS